MSQWDVYNLLLMIEIIHHVQIYWHIDTWTHSIKKRREREKRIFNEMKTFAWVNDHDEIFFVYLLLTSIYWKASCKKLCLSLLFWDGRHTKNVWCKKKKKNNNNIDASQSSSSFLCLFFHHRCPCCVISNIWTHGTSNLLIEWTQTHTQTQTYTLNEWWNMNLWSSDQLYYA